MHKNRNALDIIASMLLISIEGATRTQLMYRANLSFKLLERYLNTLIALNMVGIHEENGHKSYHMNRRGRKFLKHYFELEKLLRAHSENDQSQTLNDYLANKSEFIHAAIVFEQREKGEGKPKFQHPRRKWLGLLSPRSKK